MSREHDELIASFHHGFAPLAGQPLVIYGIGPITKAVLDAPPTVDIVGLMDPATTGKRVYGLPVLDLDEVIASEAVGIVIVARRANVPVIHRRICDATDQNELPVYDIHGTRLTIPRWGVDELPEHLLLDEATCRSLLRDADAVSFDIFDTLLVRDTLDPHDVFDIVEQRHDIPRGLFRRLRCAAEFDLSACRPPRLHEVYEEVGRLSGWTPDTLERYLTTELDTERALLRPRAEVVALFDEVRRTGTPITLISDMYMSTDVLNDLLAGCGIRGYDRILVSCEQGTSKYGHLFERYRQSVSGTNLVHVGDNCEADGLMAERFGITPIIIGSPRSLLAHSPAADIDRPNGTLAGRIQVGMFAARAFSDPFLFSRTSGRLGIARGEDLGYLIIGPIIHRLASWLLWATRNKIDVLLMAARDGWLPLRVMEELAERHRPDGEHTGTTLRILYLQTSRQCAVFAALTEPGDVYEATTAGFQGSLADLLRLRFAAPPEEISEGDHANFVADDRSQLDKHIPTILQRAACARENYLRHLRSLNISETDRVGFFDFASTGTTQSALERLLKRRIQGFYALHLQDPDPVKSALEITSLESAENPYDADSPLGRHYIFLESILSSPHASLLGFNEAGEPEYYPESRSKEEIRTMGNAHEGALDYCLRLDDLLHTFALTDADTESLQNHLLALLDDTASSVDSDLLHQLRTADEFNNRRYKWVEDEAP